MKVKHPRVGDAYRYIGEGLANGTLQRVLASSPTEVIAVQDSSQPNWSWLGSPAEFWKNFAFVIGQLPSGSPRIY